MLAAENWCLKVHNKVYGPYTTQEMRRFAREGRLASWSMVSPAGSRAWREARREIAFSTFFGGEEPSSPPPPHPKSFGRRSDCEHTISEEAIEPDASASARKPKRIVIRNEAPETPTANFVIIFDVVSAAASRVEAAMMSLGHAFRIADNVWHVSCELTAVGVRNAIAPYLRGSESIFVIDASRGRVSWRNYAPEPNAKISAAYLNGKQA
jgi:hypothetical protein